MNINLTSTMAMQFVAQSLSNISFSKQEDDPEFGDRVVPRELRGWLARLRLLEGVPFSYLVADEQLLPRESIRFFYLDRAWTDALVQGALFSVAPWLMAQLVVMPMMGMGLFSGSMQLALGSLVGHLMYGAVMGAVVGTRSGVA